MQLKNKIIYLATFLCLMSLMGCTELISKPPVGASQVLTEAAVKTNAVFRPIFETEETYFSAGTAVAVKVKGHETPVIITAMHLFGPDGGLEEEVLAADLPDFLKSTTFNTLFDETYVLESRQVLPIPEAMPMIMPYDLAAFICEDQDEAKLSTYEMSENQLEKGEAVWLVAAVSGGGSENNKLHKAIVTQVDDSTLEFKFENPDLDLTASSGAPILNKDGKVVAINIGGREQGSKLIGIANPVWGFNEMLTQAMDASAIN